MKLVPRLIAGLTLAVATPLAAGQVYQCREPVCIAKIAENGTLREVAFRRGDLVNTEDGWIVDPDDGWKKMKIRRRDR